MANETAPNRRTLAELTALYSLEPGLRDLFVEGPTDQRFYERLLGEHGINNVKVRHIGLIEIGDGILDAHGLAHGNKGRVTALALTLDSRFARTLSFVRCIVDADFDYICDTVVQSRHILYTDYTSVELYTFNAHTVRKAITSLGYDMSLAEIQSLMVSLTTALKDLFVMRAANQQLGWGMKLVIFTRCCKVVDRIIIFDSGVATERYLHKNHRYSEQGDFQRTCDELHLVHLADQRQCIHGHDYVELLGWYLQRRFNWHGYQHNKQSLMPQLLELLEFDWISQEPLYRAMTCVYE